MPGIGGGPQIKLFPMTAPSSPPSRLHPPHPPAATAPSFRPSLDEAGRDTPEPSRRPSSPFWGSFGPQTCSLGWLGESGAPTVCTALFGPWPAPACDPPHLLLPAQTGNMMGRHTLEPSQPKGHPSSGWELQNFATASGEMRQSGPRKEGSQGLPGSLGHPSGVWPSLGSGPVSAQSIFNQSMGE